MKNAKIPMSTQHPILLNVKHQLMTLVVRQCHTSIKHGGVSETLAHLRSQYSIVRGCSFVQRLIHQCVVCRRIEGVHYQAPRAPALPEPCVSEAPLFTFIRIDFAGPLYHKRSGEMLWICLFTCGVVRAVHLEIVTSLSAHSFIRCFNRFVCRRGLPAAIVSDNAKTFKSTRKLLTAIFKDPVVKEYLSSRSIQWDFNLERAPWWGGFFERLIGLMKKYLKKTIGQSRMSYDEISTLIVEAKAVLNSQPLTYVTTEDTMEPLTLFHLMTGRRLLTLPQIGSRTVNQDIEFLPQVSSSVTLHKRLTYLSRILTSGADGEENILSHFTIAIGMNGDTVQDPESLSVLATFVFCTIPTPLHFLASCQGRRVNLWS